MSPGLTREKRMKNLLKKGVVAALGLGLMAAAGTRAADATSLQQIEKKGTINVGMLVDFPPYGIMNEQNKPDGYDADVAKLLAKYLNVKLNLVPVTGPNRIPYLLSGQVDVLVASLGITPERAKKVDYSNPYAAITISVYGPKDMNVSKPADLSGKTIAVARASTQDTAITKIAPKDAKIQRFDSDATAVQALLSGQTQMIGCSNTVITQINKAAPGKFAQKIQLSKQVQGIAVKPGSDKLLAKVNAFVKHAEENGDLNKIHKKWLGEPLPDFVKTTTAKSALKSQN